MKQGGHKQYRVWSYVEEYDPDRPEESQDLGEPECLGTFNSLDQAKDYLDSVATLDPYQSLASNEQFLPTVAGEADATTEVPFPHLPGSLRNIVREH